MKVRTGSSSTMPKKSASGLCKILAISGLSLLFGPGCSLDKGSSGEIPRQNVLLEAEGCLVDNPDREQAGTILFSFAAPFDLSLKEAMEARLEVLRGDIDLVVGTENPPSDYFSFGVRPGTQKVLVGRSSREPLMGRPWYVQLVTPFVFQEVCETGDDPDWRLSVHRSTGSQGIPILEQEGQVPANASESIQIEVPEDALSMEVVLESLKGEELEEGDADLLVGLGTETESLVSLNPGTGYDVVVLDQDLCVPLRGQSIDIRLESWQQPTDFRLEVTYVPGEVDSEAPPAM
jgi:hypothetical protein